MIVNIRCYEKNTLGDIIGIINSFGTQVATYTYDAWGNILTNTGVAGETPLWAI